MRIAAATFSIFAFEALKEELQGVEALDFIFTAPTFIASEATDQLRKERREFFIPQAKRESSLYGTEFEIRLRNKLTQRAIARECADWITRSNVTFKSNSTSAPMQQFAVVDDSTAYTPLQGFTSADLGYERGDAVSNLVNRIEEAPLSSAYCPPLTRRTPTMLIGRAKDGWVAGVQPWKANHWSFAVRCSPRCRVATAPTLVNLMGPKENRVRLSFRTVKPNLGVSDAAV